MPHGILIADKLQSLYIISLLSVVINILTKIERGEANLSIQILKLILNTLSLEIIIQV